MAKIKKTKKTKIEEIAQDVAFEPINETTANLQPSLDIVQKRYADCEWCFQFDEDVPQIFAWTDPELNRDENPNTISSSSSRRKAIWCRGKYTDKAIHYFNEYIFRNIAIITRI